VTHTSRHRSSRAAGELRSGARVAARGHYADALAIALESDSFTIANSIEGVALLAFTREMQASLFG